jgi:hypothetical protein
MSVALVLRAVAGGVTRRTVQTVVLGLVVMVSIAAATLAPGPILAGWARRASRADSLPKSWHPSQ